MTTDTLAPILAQVHRAAQAQPAEAAPLFDALSFWVNAQLETGDISAIDSLREQLVVEGASQSLHYLTRLLRIVGSSQDLPDGQELQLVMLPWLLFPRQAGDASHAVSDFLCRPELERSLEHALGLPYASLRMGEFPVSSFDVEQLSVRQLRRLSLDLLAQGDSPTLMPAVLDQSVYEGSISRQVLLWPAVVRMDPLDRDDVLGAIRGAIRQSPGMAQFKHRADEMLEQELQDNYGLALQSDLFMPVLFSDAALMLRVLEINRMLSKVATKGRRPSSLVYRVVAQSLQVTLYENANDAILTDEIRIPDAGLGVLVEALRTACARMGLACSVAN